ncbi:Patatin-like phospholipase [Asanoa hainanensis]|uniref:Patatin-like phospholipase n=1 Tax=Asanoa hainanensis TaxID=560556 RepID=A0A239GKW8_9ACTN|nr:patatin-like phospholipase family protein [Asanoa hainanensis]SNS69462.1 Patatin-like phospholipase [Asanoa hainanensis]
MRTNTELRLALVLDGGADRAVWAAGVTHELDRLRRAEGPWRDLCRDTDTTVVVDIIAGTNAGGLNGILLACAVAAGEPLPTELRDLWVRDAALATGKLLDDTSERPRSLLDSAYLTKLMRSAVRPRAQRVARRGGPPREPVTLFVTAPATGGPRRYRFVADAQRQVHHPEIGPHPTARNDFTADEALVTAGRAAVGFPGAFEPVSEEPLRAHRDSADDSLFAAVVEEMSRRTVSGPYRRVLAYVGPGNRRWGPLPPSPREAAFRALGDRLAAAAESPVDRLFDRLPDEGLLATAAGLVEEYRRARTVDGIWQARRLLATDPGRPARIDVTSLDALWVPPAGARVDQAIDGPLWTWGVSAARQVVTTLLRETRRHLDGPAPARTMALSAALTKILAIDDAVRDATRSRAAADGIGPTASDKELAALVDGVVAEQRVREHLLVVVRSAAAAYAESVGVPAPVVVERALAAEVLARAFAAPSVRPHTPPFDVARICPDVSRPEQRLFGVLGTATGRADEWLWGRLDAAAHLVRLVLADQPEVVVARRIEWMRRAILDDESGRAGAADGAALEARLAAAHHRPTGERLRTFLRTDDGRATATGLARSATRLLTHGRPTAVDRAGWQHTLEAVVAEDRPADLSLLNRLARASTGPLRSGLWSALRDDPTRVATRLRNRLVLLLLGFAGLVFALGGLVGAAVALYHSGDPVFRWTAFGLVLAVLVGFLTAAVRTLAAPDPPPAA